MHKILSGKLLHWIGTSGLLNKSELEGYEFEILTRVPLPVKVADAEGRIVHN